MRKLMPCDDAEAELDYESSPKYKIARKIYHALATQGRIEHEGNLILRLKREEFPAAKEVEPDKYKTLGSSFLNNDPIIQYWTDLDLLNFHYPIADFGEASILWLPQTPDEFEEGRGQLQNDFKEPLSLDDVLFSFTRGHNFRDFDGQIDPLYYRLETYPEISSTRKAVPISLIGAGYRERSADAERARIREDEELLALEKRLQIGPKRSKK